MPQLVMLILAICGGILLNSAIEPRPVAGETTTPQQTTVRPAKGSWENYAVGPGGWIEVDPITGKPLWPGPMTRKTVSGTSVTELHVN